MTASIPNAAEAEYLSELFRRIGVLDQGHISDVVAENLLTKQRSPTLRLHLTYNDATVDAPSSLILKTGLPDSDGGSPENARREVAFYRDVASAMSARVVPRRFEASWNENTKAWHLLLEDLTDTHFIATTWPLPPSTEQCVGIVQARACLHAEWWDDSRLGSSVGRWRDADGVDRYLQILANQFASFIDNFGDLVPRDRRVLYERLLDRGPHLLARYRSHRNLTISNVDAHVWNCFLPRLGGSEDVRLIDWEVWSIDTATTDLAYMMAVHWYPDRRRRIEPLLLDRYHAALLANGVSGYGRQALDDDYRLSALWHIMTPVRQAVHQIPPRVWWNNLERILLAVDDLGCRDLLG
ncbi:aminoglycoside phosphotransferase [Labrys sp. KB_33_2]|uniref:aminoglycoside phosphotransferase n=1 Tax=Labrys sp. KB_33_2 TaxID=3237479 RepID=UPI003F8E5614